MTTDRPPLLGIALMLGFCLLAPPLGGDGIAKLLGSSVALVTLVTARFAIQAAILVPLCVATGRSLRMTRRDLRLTAWRTALHIAGIACMFTALKFLPIADAVAIAFVMPFIMLLLGKYVLGEVVGPHRLGGAATVGGFLGTLLVVQPNFLEVGGAAALLPMAVALIFALFMLVTRQMARDVDPVALQAISGLMGTLALLPPLLLMVPETPMPPAASWALIGTLGVVGTLAHLLMTWSLRYAPPAATLAPPMQYLEIPPFATAIGWLMFRDLPNGLATLGILITIGAGLYVIARERQASASTT